MLRLQSFLMVVNALCVWTGICNLYNPYNEYKPTATVLQFNLLYLTQSFRMMAFPNLILLLPLLMPCVWGKCIFDEVQESIRVLSPPDNQPNPSDNVKHDVSVSDPKDWLTHVQNHQIATSQYSPYQRAKRMVKDRTKVDDKPQPIRIKTWTPRDSPVLSQRETERLDAAARDAISTVSTLLAGIVFSYLFLDLKTINIPPLPQL